jgi:hypothetical protein
MLVPLFESDYIKKQRGRPVRNTGINSTGRVTEYNLFIRENIDKVRHLPNKERMAEIARLWKNKNHAE